eukprot:TRINITY_DN1407_c0_g1_i3.p1 TRINITY_DN1407_c0_g1~~TRINITY_DN1407_c0_g1_i3.p1  ORF type:complete len:122 (-),score=61.75 TRINITY_DN1407_c0_g1_i3:76-441(-)
MKAKTVKSPADEEGFYYACKLDEIPENEAGFCVSVNKRKIALFKIRKEKTRVYALSDRCAHQATSISSGDLEDLEGNTRIKCPGHGIEYSLETGLPKQEVAFKQKIFQVKKKNEDEVWVKL